MKASIERVIRWGLIGALLGHIGATLAAPKLIELWRASPGAGDAMCQCRELVETTTRDLIGAQLLGTFAGLLLFGGFGLFLTLSRRVPGAAPSAKP